MHKLFAALQKMAVLQGRVSRNGDGFFHGFSHCHVLDELREWDFLGFITDLFFGWLHQHNSEFHCNLHGGNHDQGNLLSGILQHIWVLIQKAGIVVHKDSNGLKLKIITN